MFLIDLLSKSTNTHAIQVVIPRHGESRKGSVFQIKQHYYSRVLLSTIREYQSVFINMFTSAQRHSGASSESVSITSNFA